MYQLKVFSEDRPEVLHPFMQKHPLATFVTTDSGGVMANLIPANIYPDAKDKGVLRLHVSRMNPQLKHFSNGNEVLVIFNGPQAYITPDYYPTKKEHGKAVPTWNYSTVQVRGIPTVFDDPEWILQQVTDLTEQMEKDRANPWHVDDAPKDYILSKLKALAGIEIQITSIQGKFKMSQNQPEENKSGVVAGLTQDDQDEVSNFVQERMKTT